jgi:hypothetical protein
VNARIHTTSAIDKPRFGHAWMDETFGPHAAVYLGVHDQIIITTPAEGREIIAAIALAIDGLTALVRPVPCPECHSVPPGHALRCPRHPAVPAYAAGGA